MLVAACETAVVAAALWWWHRTVLQQAGLVGALVVVVAAAAAHLPNDDGDLIGLAMWGLGAVWLLLGWGGVVGPRLAADVLGGVVVAVGTTFAVGPAWGSVLAIVTAVALVAAGVALRDVALLVVGSLALLVDVPVVTDRWFPDALAAPMALLVVGACWWSGRWWRRGGARWPTRACAAFAAARAGWPSGWPRSSPSRSPRRWSHSVWADRPNSAGLGWAV